MTEPLFAVGDRVGFQQFPGWSLGRITETANTSRGLVYRIRWEDGFEDHPESPWYSADEIEGFRPEMGE